jgi:hypothetical protein
MVPICWFEVVREALDNLLIAIGMGWDLDGVVAQAVTVMEKGQNIATHHPAASTTGLQGIAELDVRIGALVSCPEEPLGNGETRPASAKVKGPPAIIGAERSNCGRKYNVLSSAANSSDFCRQNAKLAAWQDVEATFNHNVWALMRIPNDIGQSGHER